MPKPRTFLPILLAAFAALTSLSGNAQASPGLEAFLKASFPDNSDIRQQFFTSLITAPKETVWAFGERSLPSRAGSVLVKTLKRSEDFFIQFVNGVEGGYPEAGRGSYLIERSAAKGYLVQAKIFLHDDPSCYVRLYPQGEGSRLDLILYGAVINQGIRLPGMFYTILTRPFGELVAATARSVDWEKAFGLGSPVSSAGFVEGLRGRGPEAERAAAIASLLGASASAEDFIAGLAARGEAAAELSGPIPALGLAQDREFLTTRLPYAAFPAYSSSLGLPLPALRAALFLGGREGPGSGYALFGEGARILALPAFDEGGRFSFAFFSADSEPSWTELAASLEGSRLRIVRF